MQKLWTFFCAICLLARGEACFTCLLTQTHCLRRLHTTLKPSFESGKLPIQLVRSICRLKTACLSALRSLPSPCDSDQQVISAAGRIAACSRRAASAGAAVTRTRAAVRCPFEGNSCCCRHAATAMCEWQRACKKVAAQAVPARRYTCCHAAHRFRSLPDPPPLPQAGSMPPQLSQTTALGVSALIGAMCAVLLPLVGSYKCREQKRTDDAAREALLQNLARTQQAAGKRERKHERKARSTNAYAAAKPAPVPKSIPSAACTPLDKRYARCCERCGAMVRAMMQTMRWCARCCEQYCRERREQCRTLPSATPGFLVLLLGRLLVPACLLGLALADSQPTWPAWAFSAVLALGVAESAVFVWLLLNPLLFSTCAACAAGGFAALYLLLGVLLEPALEAVVLIIASVASVFVLLWQALASAWHTWLGCATCVLSEKCLIAVVGLPLVVLDVIVNAIGGRSLLADEVLEFLFYPGSKTGVCNAIWDRPPDTSSNHWWY